MAASGCGGDGCRAAVIETYRGLRHRGINDRSAFEAATIVFCNHHPEVERAEAPYRIAGWIEAALSDE
ncbi:MAG: hypothetical protein ACTSX7_02405 [Alphaproteobacteria bacterium]